MNYTIHSATHSDCLAIANLGISVWANWSNGLPLPIQLIKLSHPIFVAKRLNNELTGYSIG